MASDDPFAQISMANMYIGEKPPDQNNDQTQQQPSYDVWGLTPTVAPAAPAAVPGYPPNTTTTTAVAPPMMQAPPPSPMQAPAPVPIMQPPPAAAVNPYYAQQQQQQQQMYAQQQQMYPPPLQVQQQQQQQQPPMYAAPAPAYAAAPTYAPAPAPVVPVQAPAPPPPSQPAAAPPAVSYDPFAATPAAPPPPTTDPFASNPFAAAASSSSRDESPPPQRPANAPEESIFEVGEAAPEPSGRKIIVPVSDKEADFWTQMGFAVQEETKSGTSSTSSSPARGMAGGKRMSLRANVVRTVPKSSAEKSKDDKKEDAKEEFDIDNQGLPHGGEYYKATLPGGYFGAVLLRGIECTESLFSTTHKSFTTAIGDRPVVAYTSQDSCVDKAGIAVGDVILKVEDKEVNTPKTALHAIRKTCDAKCGYRGIELYVWTPPTSVEVTLAENQCMVQYHGHNTNVPSTSWEWKSKYVVVGGVVADPWSVNMYYNKKDYDIAVSELNAKQSRVSVKVKTFSLLGAKLLTPKPKTVFYSTQSSHWYFIIVQLEKGKAIKIGHPLRDGLLPVMEGIQRALVHDPVNSNTFRKIGV